MDTLHEVRYSPDSGIDLGSILESPQIGRQVSTVTDLSTSEPVPHFFPTHGRLHPHRQTQAPAR